MPLPSAVLKARIKKERAERRFSDAEQECRRLLQALAEEREAAQIAYAEACRSAGLCPQCGSDSACDCYYLAGTPSSGLILLPISPDEDRLIRAHYSMD